MRLLSVISDCIRVPHTTNSCVTREAAVPFPVYMVSGRMKVALELGHMARGKHSQCMTSIPIAMK